MTIFFHENEFAIVICKMTAICFGPNVQIFPEPMSVEPALKFCEVIVASIT